MADNVTDVLVAKIVEAGLLRPEREYVFAKPRRWRFDLAFPSRKVAVEIEGGVYVGGRHARGAGYEGDAEKYNVAAILGWIVLRFTTGQIRRALIPSKRKSKSKKKPVDVLRIIENALEVGGKDVH